MIRELAARVAPPGAPLPALAARDVTDAELALLLGAARVAPSADNLQTWRFVVVRNADARAALGPLFGVAAPSVLCAPVVLVLCGVRLAIRQLRREQPFVLIDVPIALTHLLLEAAELGLRAAWSIDFDEAACGLVIGLPADARPIAVVALGWPQG